MCHPWLPTNCNVYHHRHDYLCIRVSETLTLLFDGQQDRQAWVWWQIMRTSQRCSELSVC
jgi:hypothetical protein